jgi:hypothetical protein
MLVLFVLPSLGNAACARISRANEGLSIAAASHYL